MFKNICMSWYMYNNQFYDVNVCTCVRRKTFFSLVSIDNRLATDNKMPPSTFLHNFYFLYLRQPVILLPAYSIIISITL